MPEGEFSDALILAALERAELHHSREETGAFYPAIVAHLGLRMGPGTGRRLRPRIREMEAGGLLKTSKRLGMVLYTATPRADKLLAKARRTGELVALPESPQHRVWRESRAAAGEQIGGFREGLTTLLGEAASLLTGEAPDSEEWFVLGERLQRACSRLGSATHCMLEWAEPDEAKADVDDHRRRGRRNVRLWD